MLETQLSFFPEKFRDLSFPFSVLAEAKKRVLDSLACFYGAFDEKSPRILRHTLCESISGKVALWGTSRRVPAEFAAWANGAHVRALDFNDTYLSREPCHPSDLIATLWAACELSGSGGQGRKFLHAMVLGYEVLCRLCDARSLRLRGWDHVTYLPIASAVVCSYILGLDVEQTRHAIALAVTGNNALRQTRVGTLSDWKAACAAYAARSGLWAARLAKNGFTGPSDVFSGRHGFFNQVSGRFGISKKPFGHPWKILETHTKFFPAEHHAQSAIEAALDLRSKLLKSTPHPAFAKAMVGKPARRSLGEGGGRGIYSIKRVVVETFDVAAAIIGSEKEKWTPRTRETADHSMPYLVSAALLDGNVTLGQYQKKRFLDADVRSLMKRVRVKSSARYSKAYPKKMPARVSIQLSDGMIFSSEILLPKGYAGRPMTEDEIVQKFNRLATPKIGVKRASVLVNQVSHMERLSSLKLLTKNMVIRGA